MNHFEIISFIGLAALLSAFALNSLDVIYRHGYLYNILNLIGGTSLTVYSIEIGSTAFIALQSIWSLIALYGLLSKLYKDFVRR